MNVVSLLTATLMLATVFSASGQTTAVSLPTPLSELLGEAQTNNPQISAANHGALAAQQLAAQMTDSARPEVYLPAVKCG